MPGAEELLVDGIPLRIVHVPGKAHLTGFGLDVGSGTGFYVQAWRDLGAGSVTGCDLTQAAVDRLRSARDDLAAWLAGEVPGEVVAHDAADARDQCRSCHVPKSCLFVPGPQVGGPGRRG